MTRLTFGLRVPTALSSQEWRRWHIEMKARYPLRHFFYWDASIWFSRQWRRLTDLVWWFRHRLQPSKRYHFLDLRRGDPSGKYRAGWLDSVTQLEFAACAIVRNYVEHELSPSNHIETEHDQAARELYEFFMVDLPALRALYDDILDRAVSDGWDAGDPRTPDQEAAFAETDRLEAEIRDRIKAAIKKLADNVGGMWS